MITEIEKAARAAYKVATKEMGYDLYDTQNDAFCDGFDAGVKWVQEQASVVSREQTQPKEQQ